MHSLVFSHKAFIVGIRAPPMDLLINYAATNFIVNCSWMRIKTVGRYKIARTVSLS
jgi:hypothetical protein